MSKFPCSMCGSTNWPNPDSSCPLCQPSDCIDRDEDDKFPSSDDDDYDE